MITLQQYWMGRDLTHKGELTREILDNATNTVARANLLIALFEKETGIILSGVASGWRPAGVNAATSNAGKSSNHITADAVDIRDNDARAFARWCLRNLNKLAEFGLWMENPQWCPTWVHLQTVPPKSGKRVYIPSLAAPLCALLPEQC